MFEKVAVTCSSAFTPADHLTVIDALWKKLYDKPGVGQNTNATLNCDHKARLSLLFPLTIQSCTSGMT